MSLCVTASVCTGFCVYKGLRVKYPVCERPLCNKRCSHCSHTIQPLVSPLYFSGPVFSSPHLTNHLHIFTSTYAIFTSSQLYTSSIHFHIYEYHPQIPKSSRILSLSLSLSLFLPHLHILTLSHLLSYDESHTYTCRCAPLRSRVTRRLELLRAENQNVRFDFVHSFLSRKVVDPNNDGLDPHDRQNQGRLRIALAQLASHAAGRHASKDPPKKNMRRVQTLRKNMKCPCRPNSASCRSRTHGSSNQ